MYECVSQGQNLGRSPGKRYSNYLLYTAVNLGAFVPKTLHFQLIWPQLSPVTVSVVRYMRQPFQLYFLRMAPDLGSLRFLTFKQLNNDECDVQICEESERILSMFYTHTKIQ